MRNEELGIRNEGLGARNDELGTKGEGLEADFRIIVCINQVPNTKEIKLDFATGGIGGHIN